MRYSAGFIITIPNPQTFNEIKSFLETLPDTKIIYMTRGDKKLYISSEGVQQ